MSIINHAKNYRTTDMRDCNTKSLKDECKKHLNYMYQFQKGIESITLKEFLEYKFDKHWKIVDLDVSFDAMLTYAIVYAQYDIQKFHDIYDKIKLQDKQKYKYCIKPEPDLEIVGDWLTSPLHMIKLYMGLMWEEEKSKDSKGKLHNKEYVNLFNKTSNKHLLYAPAGSWENYCQKNIDVIWNSFDGKAKRFLNNTFMAGNFIPMLKYINPCRCNFNNDTLDSLLWKMYCCFQLSKDSEKLENYIKNAFTGKYAKLAISNVKKWMEIFNYSWDDFLSANDLTMAVGKNKIPLSLQSGETITINIGGKYDPEPQNFADCLRFFDNFNLIIETRTEKIWTRINKWKKF